MSLRGERERKGLTQTGLSKISGVAREQINRYENGKRLPDLSCLIRLRDALGCTLDDLVSEDEEGSHA